MPSAHQKLVPRRFEPVGSGSYVEGPLRVTRSVEALRVSGGHLVSVLELVGPVEPGMGVPCSPTTTLFFMPAETIELVRRDMFEDLNDVPMENAGSRASKEVRDGTTTTPLTVCDRTVITYSVDGGKPITEVLQTLMLLPGNMFHVRSGVKVTIERVPEGTFDFRVSLGRSDIPCFSSQRFTVESTHEGPVSIEVLAPRMVGEKKSVILCFFSFIGFEAVGSRG